MKPPPQLNLVEWADTYRYLGANNAEPGRWRTDRVEPARQPMLSISNPKVSEITIMSCIQLMKTELMINTAMFYMHQEPSPLMYVAPKKETAEAWSKERLVTNINVTPVLKDIFSGNRRGEGNTILQKQFPGGQISIVSAGNPTDLAMRPCRILLFDEVDKYEKNVGAGAGGEGGEGDAIGIAWGRSTTYGKRAKKIVACSPTVDGGSRIQDEYLKSNQCVFLQKCPHCGFEKELTWLDVKFPEPDPETGELTHIGSHIACDAENGGCGKPWSEGDRLRSIRTGRYMAKRPEVTWHHGYKATSLSSPFTPVELLVKEFLAAMGNTQLLKVFYNTRMAQPWKEVGEQPDWKTLHDRREHYTMDRLPRGALMITCGIDVQRKGIFFEYVAWGRRKENWSIDCGYIEGDISTQEMRDEVYRLTDRVFKSCTGVDMMSERTCIDSGDQTQIVYGVVREYPGDRLVAVKGEKKENLNTIIGTPTPVDVNVDGVRHSRGLMKWNVGSSVTKEQFYAWLNLTTPTETELAEGRLYPSGYCHFPNAYDEEYFKQITGEQYIRKEDKRGFVTYEWDKVRKDNHFLDCRVYARAGAAMLQIDRMSEDDWYDRERLYCPDVVQLDDNTEKYDTVPNRTAKPRRQGKWVKRNG